MEELLAQYARNEAFYRKGGITVTGGEPLLQIEFVTALFRDCLLYTSDVYKRQA